MLTTVLALRDFINCPWARALADATRPDTPLGRMRIIAEQAAKNVPPWPAQEVAFDSRTAQLTIAEIGVADVVASECSS